MMPLNYVLAVALLTAPSDDKADIEHLNTQAMRSTVKAVALEWEILDPREVKYVFSRKEDFASDLKLVRKRYVDLQDAPPLYDCMRFPNRECVNEMLTFNRKYREHLVNAQMLDLSNAEWYRQAISETDQLYQIWDLVRDSRCDYYYVTVRRDAMKKLMGKIGRENFYGGWLPPHVPIWRFSRID